MRQFEAKERQLGGIIFYVRPLPAFTAVNITGELFGTILPALTSIAPVVAGKSDLSDLLDMDSAEAAQALAKGASSISGDKLEYLLKKLLVQHKNISFEETSARSGEPKILTENLADEIFCNDVQDMFILAFDVMKGNYGGFFEKLGTLFGDQADALKTLITKTEPSLENMAS